MKIDILSSDGIHASEKEAIKRMVEVFNASSFSQKWHGYAGFMMMDTTYRDREIDLVLLTHDRLLIVELKKWRGKIEPMHDHWLRDGDDMGRSPVKVLADKWKILSSKIKTRLSAPATEVYIDYRVVMCGSADFSEIPEDEKSFVCTLEQFLKLPNLGGTKANLVHKKRVSLVNICKCSHHFLEVRISSLQVFHSIISKLLEKQLFLILMDCTKNTNLSKRMTNDMKHC